MLSCLVRERGRGKLGLTLAGICSILSVLGVVTICASVYMKVKIDDRIILLGSYSGSAFTDFIIATGCLVFFINGFVTKVALDSSDQDTRDTFQGILFFMVGVLYLLAILVLVAAILCYHHHFDIDEALESGFLAAMMKYKSEAIVKTELDILQMEFRCCGADSYVDWFHVSWIHRNYINTSDSRIKLKLKANGYLTDDVPFSCCDIGALRPCIHHSMTHASKHPSFDRETIHTIGCNKALMKYYKESVFLPAGHVAIAAFSLQILATILLRLLQTSIRSAEEYGDPDGPGEAYIIKSLPCMGSDSGGVGDWESGGGGSGSGGGGGGKEGKDKKKDKNKDKNKDKKKKDTKKKKGSSKSKSSGKAPRKGKR